MAGNPIKLLLEGGMAALVAEIKRLFRASARTARADGVTFSDGETLQEKHDNTREMTAEEVLRIWYADDDEDTSAEQEGRD